MALLYPGDLDNGDDRQDRLKVSSRVASFYGWLRRWHAQTGDVHPGTRYLAAKQKVSEATIYRWLARLEEAGWISREVVPGVERSITPLFFGPLARGSRGAVARGPQPLSSYAGNAPTKAPPPAEPEAGKPDAAVVAKLKTAGFALDRAESVAKTYSVEALRTAHTVVERYAKRHEVQSYPALLVAALKGNWGIKPPTRHPNSNVVTAPKDYVQRGG